MRGKQYLPIPIASILCYLWGSMLLALAVAVAIPMFSGHGLVIAAALFPLVVFTVATTYCVGGYLVGRRRRFGAWFGVTLAVMPVILQFVMHLFIMHINLTATWLMVNALVLVFLLTNWRQFGQRRPNQ